MVRASLSRQQTVGAARTLQDCLSFEEARRAQYSRDDLAGVARTDAQRVKAADVTDRPMGRGSLAS